MGTSVTLTPPQPEHVVERRRGSGRRFLLLLLLGHAAVRAAEPAEPARRRLREGASRYADAAATRGAEATNPAGSRSSKSRE